VEKNPNYKQIFPSLFNERTWSHGASGMRFVLVCQVLDGEPPIQIKWFKDDRELAHSLQPLAAQQMLGLHHESPFGSAKSLLGASAALRDDPSGQETAGQTQDIEMISNDELGASLLFRKVKQHHGGNYTCLAANHLGSSSYSAYMTVKGEYPPATLSAMVCPIAHRKQPAICGQGKAGGRAKVCRLVGRWALGKLAHKPSLNNCRRPIAKRGENN